VLIYRRRVKSELLSRRVWRWIAVLAVADVIAFALSIHSQVDYRTAPGSPSTTTLNQVMGWIISFGLLLAIVLIVLAARYDRQMRGPKR
jgi:hypothetical protein